MHQTQYEIEVVDHEVEYDRHVRSARAEGRKTMALHENRLIEVGSQARRAPLKRSTYRFE
jgi:hypothetical protein